MAQKPKENWPPCVTCGEPNGAVSAGRRTPYRALGRCKRCYERLAQRRWRDQNKTSAA